MNERNFDRDGVVVVPEFLTQREIALLNQEMDTLLGVPSVNGSLFQMDLGRGLKQILLPTLNIRSLNLLELALKVRNLLLEKSKERFYQLTHLEIYSEIHNPEPLFWHTDNRPGMIRAQIYLRGGQANSGAFQYMVGTHTRDYHVEHKLSRNQIASLSEKIRDCAAPEGSLVLFDPMGFHSKSSNQLERRSIMFEFQPPETDYPKARVFLSSEQLSQTVLDNISFFQTRSQSALHGGECYFRTPVPLPVLASLRLLLQSLRKRSLKDLRDTYRTLKSLKFFNGGSASLPLTPRTLPEGTGL